MSVETGGELVCILFSDLVGWTAMGDRIGDDAADTVRRAHFAATRQAVRSHRGREVKTAGDGMLVVFRSAIDALGCAGAIAQVNAAAGVKVRVGVHAGEPIADGGDVYGTVVNTASRLCDAAAPGEVLVSEVVRSLVGRRGRFSFEDRGSLTLKGLRDPVAAFRLGPAGETSDTGDGFGATMRYAVLGPLEVVRQGRRVEPKSPKQLALLIDLLVNHHKTLSRDRLIEDLWGDDPPATAAGVLQNYVSQLRKALGPKAVRTTGSGYAIDIDAEALDSARFEGLVELARAARAAGDMDGVAERLRAALTLWRGEPLADVAFEPFAQAEIARLRELRAEATELLLEAEIATGRHRAALGALEAALVEYPLRERLWWLLMLALYRSGRQADALRAYQKARAVLREELGLEPAAELRDLETAILQQQPALERLLLPTAAPRPAAAGPHIVGSRPRARPLPVLVGRTDERAEVVTFVDAAIHDGRGGLLLLAGEPGIGKTRLLEEARAHAEEAGGIVIYGRGFEAERGRPYGTWVDALRSVALPPVPDPLRGDLSPLLPELSTERADLDDSSRLYDAVVALFRHLAADTPTVVLLDDLQWLDEASCTLAHFAVRQLAGAGVAFVATARSAELEDNQAVRQVVQALRREDMLVEMAVGPLPAATIGDLTRPIAPDADPARIAEASNGNPLLALEMAHALARGTEPLSSRLDALIGDRLGRLNEAAAGLVPWLAAFGRNIDSWLLAQAVDREPVDLFEPLGELERHGVVAASSDGTYGFVHDLVRTAAYKRISTPRRAMLHARIGKVLTRAPDPDDTLAADAARHADAGSDSATCAAACIRAARRCVRLLAYREAEEHVELGRAHARKLVPEVRIPLEIQLIHVLIHPGLRFWQPGDLADDLTELCAGAQRLGLDAELATGLYLLGFTYQRGWRDIPRATALLERVARMLEVAPEPDVGPLLDGARCLAYLEFDMERTSQLFDQLGGLGDLVASSVQYQWGLGLVQAWAGQLPEARAAFGRAIELATTRGEHWPVFECTTRLAVLEIEAGAHPATALCDQLGPLATKLGEGGSEAAYARAVCALGALTAGEEPGGEETDSFESAIAELDRLDAGFLTPHLLGIAAEAEYRSGDLATAETHAGRALRVAAATGRPLEAARARALLACIAARNDAPGAAIEQLNGETVDDGRLPRHVVALRREAEALAGSPLSNRREN